MKLSGNNCLKSPELLEMYYLLKRQPIPNYIVAEEFISIVNFVEVTDEIFVSGKGNLFSQLVDASGIDKLGDLLYRILYKFEKFLYISFNF